MSDLVPKEAWQAFASEDNYGDRQALEAAAPYIIAAELDRLAEKMVQGVGNEDAFDDGMVTASRRLRFRASELRGEVSE